jgi:predicted Zn-dependent peptidase
VGAARRRRLRHQEPRFHRAALAGGLTVVSEYVPWVRSASLGIWVRSGSRDESDANLGVSHFLEHMLFKGTARRNTLEIAQSLESLGGHLDAFTGREQTCYYGRFLDEHLPQAVDVLADLVTAPLFDPEEIEKEKGVVIDEISSYEDEPDELVHDLFADLIWNGHVLGRSILGTRETVQGFERASLVDYFRLRYTPANLVVALAGAFDREQFLDLVARHMTPGAEGPADAAGVRPDAGPGPDALPPFEAGVVNRPRDFAQLYLCLGARAFPYDDEDRFALQVLSMILGGGMSSRLFQQVREKAGLAYSVYSYADFYRDTGLFCISLDVTPDRGRRALRLVLDEIARLRRDGLVDGELAAAKAQLKGSLLLGLESLSSRMSRIARNEIYFGRNMPVRDLVRQVERVTEEEVLAVAGRVLADGRLSLVALGPLPEGPYRLEDLVLG